MFKRLSMFLLVIWVASLLAINAMNGNFGKCTQPYLVGNAMQYKVEHFGEIYLQNGKLTANELKFFMEIFQDWKRDYDAPLADEIAAFNIMIKEVQT